MLIELKNICRDFPQGRDMIRILKNINLCVDKGEYLAIMGPSGSGKTTLMNTIGCLDTPTSGEYFLDGESLIGASDDKLSDIRNSKIGFVFQSFYLLPGLTALDNVALPLLYANVSKAERKERAAAALEKVGLQERMDFYPNQISGGQSQRVAIARAMINNPSLLLADEPTGALDSASGRQVMDLFDSLNASGTTIILITHAQEVADRSNKTRYILDGEFVESLDRGETKAAAKAGEGGDSENV